MIWPFLVRKMMRINIVGLGLIGGSLAKAIKHYTNNTVIGVDQNPEVTKAALACGAVDEITDFCPDADLYFLCMSPQVVCSYLKANIKRFRPGAVISDVCGIKQLVESVAQPLCNQNGLCYIGGHPMAGREVSSFFNSDYNLFENRSYLLVVHPNTNHEKLNALCGLIRELGVSGIKFTTPQEHDEMIAFTSQLPHIIAGAYMLSKNSTKHEGFSAGSFHDVSRVATVDENLWTQLFLQNKTFLLPELSGLIEHLKAYQTAIEQNNAPALKALIKEGRERKERDQKTNGAELPHKFG